MTETMTMPCPFCGATGDLIEITPWHGGGPDKHMVSCINDDCEAQPQVTGETRSLAIAAWNRRAKSAGPFMTEQKHTGEATIPLTLVERLRNTPNWRRESYGSWKDCVSEYDRSPFEAADELERLTAEISRRKGDPRTRLHNLCEAIAEEADGSEFSREEWDRIDAENSKLRAEVSALRASHAELRKALKALCEYDSKEREQGAHGYAIGSACDKRWKAARAALAHAPE